ncbi:MAG: class I adenylate-forming enzyme family protein [Kofleriaceae bacterium]
MPLLYDWLSKAAKAQGSQKKALVYRDNYLSWRGLLERVDRRAQEFKAMGIREGAWVGLMLGNVPDFVVLALALSKLGAAIVPIDPTTGARELELMLTAAPLRALVTRPRGSEGTINASGQTTPPPPTQPAASSPRPRGARTTVPPAPGGGAIGAASSAGGASLTDASAEVRRRLQGTLLTCSVYKDNALDIDVEPLAILFTSDSLGDPKAVLRSEKNTVAAVDHAIAALKLDASSRLLVAVPLFHAYGWDLGLLPTLRLGATMFLEEELSARRIGKLIREHKIDVFPGTPHMYADLNRQPTAKKLEVDKPRFLAAGSRLDPAVAEEFLAKYGIRIQSCYHSTEASTIALDATGKSPGSVGKLLSGVDVRVTGSNGKAVTGKEGLVWVRSKALAPHSLGPYDHEVGKAPAKPGIGAVDKQGWFRTGDLGKLDKTGRLFLTGREDDVVKVEGKRVALGEVEGCLESFPKVKQAQALVINDPLVGSMVIARVVPKSSCQPEEIIDHCARNLAPYKVPRRIEFCDAI